MDALEIRKLRKKLRQIEALEHLPRDLTPSEIEKVSRKLELRRLLEELLSRHVDVIQEEETVETNGSCSVARTSLPDSSVRRRPASDAASTPGLYESAPQVKLKHPGKTPNSAEPLRRPSPLQHAQFLLHSLEGHSDLVTCVLIHDTYIISGSWDTSVRVWDIASCVELKMFSGHTGGVTCLALIAQGESKLNSDLLPAREDFVASGSTDSSVKVWSLITGQPLLSIYTFSAVSAVTHIPDTKLLISGSDGGKIDVWDLETQENLRSQRAHGEKVSALQYYSGLLYSGSSDGSLKIWRLSPSGSLSLLHSCDALMHSLRGLHALCATGDQVYLATQGACLKAVNWKQDRLTRLSNHTSSSGFADAVAVTAGNLLVTSGFNIDQGHGYLNVRDVKTGYYLSTLSSPDLPRILCVAASCTPGGLCRWVTGGRELLLLWEELPKGGAVDGSAVQAQFCSEFLLPATESESEEDEEEDLWAVDSESVSSHVQAETRGWQWCILV
ncbi:WD repeat-containing protein 5-like [Pseudophryne corroboree]|uniref:WD repeat-containing protein 5-like n=1 Tax=Pseudophryne corroboree TaxID=495146 RepID=UPI003081E260